MSRPPLVRPSEVDDADVSTTISTNSTVQRYLRRAAASQYVRERWGMPCSTSWLAKLAVVGGGPPYRKAGRFPIYAPPDLDAWARGRIGPQLSSTSAERR